SRISGRRAGGNDIERVPNHIGDDQAVQAMAREGLGQPASLDARQMFADGVHLIDGRSAFMEEEGDLLFFLQGHAGNGSRQEGRSPPEIRHRATSSGPALPSRARILSAPSTPAAVGWLLPAGRAAWRWMAFRVRTLSAGTLTHPTIRSM